MSNLLWLHSGLVETLKLKKNKKKTKHIEVNLTSYGIIAHNHTVYENENFGTLPLEQNISLHEHSIQYNCLWNL